MENKKRKLNFEEFVDFLMFFINSLEEEEQVDWTQLVEISFSFKDKSGQIYQYPLEIDDEILESILNDEEETQEEVEEEKSNHIEQENEEDPEDLEDEEENDVEEEENKDDKYVKHKEEIENSIKWFLEKINNEDILKLNYELNNIFTNSEKFLEIKNTIEGMYKDKYSSKEKEQFLKIWLTEF